MKEASIAVGNRRLLKLAEFLRTVPRKRFNYTQWIGPGWKGDERLSCGTTACALGWAATMPAFRRLGVRLVPASAIDSGGVVALAGNFEVRSLRLAMSLFGLEHLDAMHLFTPGFGEKEATPKYVAKKIEKFVKARSK